MDNIFKKFAFGIEFETCVNLGRDIGSYSEVHEAIVDCFNNKPLGLQWEILEKYCFSEIVSDIESDVGSSVRSYDSNVCANRRRRVMPDILTSFYLPDSKTDEAEEKKYTKWGVISDYSVECPGKSGVDKGTNYCIINGRKKACPSVNFYQVEIVSPILRAKNYKGFREFLTAWFGYIMSDKITYLVNNTQGLHIHLSHPKLNADKFITLWRVFQPVLQNIVPKWRRNSKWNEAVIDDYPTKYNAVNPIDINHVEVRLYQGTAVYLEIYMWLLFCLLFARLSIIIDKDTTNLHKLDRATQVKLLFALIEDKNVCEYFLRKYNKNKSKKFPTISMKFSKTIIPTTILSRKDWKKIRLNSAKC